MKDTEHIHISAILDQIRNAVVTVKENSDIPGGAAIAMPNLGVLRKHLRLLIDAVYNSVGCGRIISSYVLVDIAKPSLRFIGPNY